MTDGTAKILIVDDQATARKKMALAIERLGHTSVPAENGYRALEILRTEKFDLVLLDIIMPEMDGYEVLTLIKSDSSLNSIPILVVSSLDEIQSVVRAIELGAVDHLLKNSDPVLLNARVEACLEKKRIRDQEIDYLHQVARLTAIAATIEANNFDVGKLNLESIASRKDELGGLARVFGNMAGEVYRREQHLKEKIQDLQIQVDEVRQKNQVNSITGTDYFKDLRGRAGELRKMLENKKE